MVGLILGSFFIIKFLDSFLGLLRYWILICGTGAVTACGIMRFAVRYLRYLRIAVFAVYAGWAVSSVFAVFAVMRYLRDTASALLRYLRYTVIENSRKHKIFSK